ncbi:MAG: HD domain-containing protein [Rhodospirillales bacterium]|nr:HD domain-containing protein [Rhodospirillales bacterium]MDE2576604.1 HD domain-containing protein [Rhodospirillales bacterium]
MRWERLSAAIAYALMVHADQERKGAGTPYIAHLLAVCALVLEAGGDEEQAMGAVLHDAIEDGGPLHEAEIETRFGARVAGIVRGCTDSDTLPRPPWRARKEVYLAHLRSAPPDVLLVSCADKLHNARAIVTDGLTHGAAIFDRFSAGRDGVLWYYAALAEIFSGRLPGPLSRDLSRAVAEMRMIPMGS